ncbi:MAG: GMC family oxidoreductase [Armatimonadetes bacterium]|nr:GMC family oxidoreductase [Armatimonadota bacterium]
MNAIEQTLRAVAEAVLSDRDAAKVDLDALADRMAQIADANPNIGPRTRLKRLLKLISSRLGMALLGAYGPFASQPLSARRQTLMRWSTGRPLQRTAFQALKRLALFAAYGCEPSLWPIGYEPLEPSAGFDLETSDLPSEADFIVVGSGAGGSVAAAALAQAGFDVCVLESGINPRQLGLNEADGFHQLFLGGGALTTRDLSVSILAGGALGGGTTVNWLTCYRPPTLDQWERDSGLPKRKIEEQIERIESRLEVNDNPVELNLSNLALQRGCQNLGWSVHRLRRNGTNCADRCAPCTFGCPYGAKQSAPLTYLKDACAHGAKIVCDAPAKRILFNRDRATGVELSNGEQVMARRGVVIACGAIESPALLLRSGLRGIGANLSLHVTTATFAQYDDPVSAFWGAPQAVACDQFLDEGILIETPALYPGFAAAAFPWPGDPLEPGLAVFLSIIADAGEGRITLDRHGQAVIDYRPGTRTSERLLKGIEEMIRLHEAAGGRNIRTLHQPPTDRPGKIVPNRIGLFSAHQMGSCSRAVDALGRAKGKDGLFIADASLFPTSLGVNPMITVMALAAYVAEDIVASS